MFPPSFRRTHGTACGFGQSRPFLAMPLLQRNNLPVPKKSRSDDTMGVATD